MFEKLGMCYKYIIPYMKKLWSEKVIHQFITVMALLFTGQYFHEFHENSRIL